MEDVVAVELVTASGAGHFIYASVTRAVCSGDGFATSIGAAAGG